MLKKSLNTNQNDIKKFDDVNESIKDLVLDDDMIKMFPEDDDEAQHNEELL